METVRGKCIFIFVESDLRWKFFTRFHKTLDVFGYEVVYVTNCLTVWIRGKLEGYNVILSKFKLFDKKIYKANIQTKSIKKEILDVEIGDVNADEAAIILTKWNDFFCSTANKYKPRVCFIYNGTSIFTYAAKKWAQNYKIKSLFFELANIDGKMFVDPWGTNAKSKAYADDVLLDTYKMGKEDFDTWLNNYRNHKKNVKQALVSRKISNIFFYAINKIWFLGYLKRKRAYVNKELKRFIYRYKKDLFKKDNKVIKLDSLKPYYLFPMQVSIDSQILLNSDVSLERAIIYAREKAKKNNVNLLIKLHPAERDNRIKAQLEKIQSDSIFVVDKECSIDDFIDNAEKIITINSTVGLEAILHDKDVEFLGRSLYKKILKNKNELLNKYISYLIDIDYFNDKDIDANIVSECLHRADFIRRSKCNQENIYG